MLSSLVSLSVFRKRTVKVKKKSAVGPHRKEVRKRESVVRVNSYGVSSQRTIKPTPQKTANLDSTSHTRNAIQAGTKQRMKYLRNTKKYRGPQANRRSSLIDGIPAATFSKN